MAKDERGWVYIEDGVPVYRMSSIGACIRGLVAARQGIPSAPRPQAIQDAMDVSSGMEEAAFEAMKDRPLLQPLTFEILQAPCEMFFNEIGKYDTLLVRGTADAVGEVMGKMSVIEVKNVSEKSFRQYEQRGFRAFGQLGIQYEWQISAYMLALDLPGVFVVRNKATGELAEWVYQEPPISMSQIAERIGQVEEAARSDEYPECDRKCSSWSPYWEVHEQKELTPADDALADLLANYAAAKAVKDAATHTLDDLADRIKNAYAPGTYDAGPLKAVISVVHTSRFNTSRFRKDHGELYEEYRDPQPDQIRLTVTDKGASPDAVDPA